MNLRRVLEPWTTQLVALDGVRSPVVVGCSGGPDSLALLALARAAGLDVVAVCVDHGVRRGTEHEHGIVRAAAARFGATARVEFVEVEQGSNLEARARDARYRSLDAVRRDVGATAILVGHTRDDQAETVLLHFLRGSGAAGLAGMAEVRGAVRRPLLSLRRSDTREICALLSLAPADDPMNSEMHYRRVWLRRDVVPRLEAGARRDLVDVLARQATVLRDDDDLLESLATEAIRVDSSSLAVDELARAPRALARRAIRRWLGHPLPSLAHVDAVLDVVSGERRALELPGGRRVERAGGRVHLVPGGTWVAADAVAIALPGHARFGPWTVEAWVENGAPVAWPDGRVVAVVDADQVDAHAYVRPPKAGDRFRPVGGRGSKLVHDALAEVGVPASRRGGCPVLADAGGVVWVVGYRVDDRVRVTSRTRRFLWITSEVAANE